jgi:mono/diheme cytochrome c family protein
MNVYVVSPRAPAPRACLRRRLIQGAAGILLVGVLAAGLAWFLRAGAVSAPGDPADRAQVEAGERLYAAHCANCHGKNLEGDPNWQSRLPNGRLRPPPHDDTGHSWHHADPLLFAIIKDGLVPPIVPAGYETDMPAFGDKLSDKEIWSVLAFIKSRWFDEARAYQKTVTDDTARRTRRRGN